MHIAVPRDRIGNRGAITVVNPVDGRVMFVLPAGSQAIVGTTDTFTDESPDEVRATAGEVRYLLAAANSYFPDAKLKEDDVISAWAGIRPLAAATSGVDPSGISGAQDCRGQAGGDHGDWWEADDLQVDGGGSCG